MLSAVNASSPALLNNARVAACSVRDLIHADHAFRDSYLFLGMNPTLAGSLSEWNQHLFNLQTDCIVKISFRP